MSLLPKSQEAAILTVSAATRSWAEKVARETNHFDSSLCGMCGIASARLHLELKKHYINTKIAVNKSETHAFLLYNDRVVIDITATQFDDYPDVLIIPADVDYDGNGTWIIDQLFRSAEDFALYQKQSKWPKYQQVEI